MKAESSTPAGELTAEPYDFSLVLGGPLYQIFRRAHLSGSTLELLRRRIVVISLFAWLPLLILSLAEGRGWGGGVAMPFLYDVDVHVRFLIALPLLLVAELVVHKRMRPLIRQFMERGLIADTAKTKFDAAFTSAMRLRNSVVAEVVMIAFVYGVGVMIIWRTHAAVDVASWYGGGTGHGKPQPSLAGLWFGCISLPLFQFILLRWYFRLFVWARFLWQVSRIELKLVPIHPDRCGGLGFLANVSTAFAPLLLAQGALLAGTIANQIFFVGAKLPQFKVEIVAMVAVALFAVLGPLLVFIPVLARAKRVGLREYGSFAQRYVHDFDRKWIRGADAPAEPLLGNPDIQSLADLGNSFEIVRGMRSVPFAKETFLQLAALTLVPLLPLTLTMISLEELLGRVLKVVF
ncbi:MAG TPA: hypothetical protein VJT81_10485 [Burkholderiales bacterium]|nr:hypothetical protein [Burkholderiales bacterium]